MANLSCGGRRGAASILRDAIVNRKQYSLELFEPNGIVSRQALLVGGLPTRPSSTGDRTATFVERQVVFLPVELDWRRGYFA
jgi:hypothetical protein